MQISDMLTQYNRNIATGTEIAGGTQGIKQVISAFEQMSVGNVFEGNINSIENGVVTLGLPDGKTIQARLEQGVSVKVGQSMFFQVKANNGMQIAIRPFSDGISSNPTLLQALEAANLQINDKMLSMVNAMMEESMPIDKQSLMDMAKLVMGNESMDIHTIVQMRKLGIPVTDEMLTQFQNYKSDQYAVLDQLENVMKSLPKQLVSGKMTTNELLDFNQQMAKVLLGEGESALESAVIKESTALTEAAVVKENVTTKEQQAFVTRPLEEQKAQQSDVLSKNQPDAKIVINEEILQTETMQETMDKTAVRQLKTGTVLSELFSSKQLQNISEQLAKVVEFADNQEVFTDGRLNPKLTSKELLGLLEEAFSSKNPFSRQALGELISGREYRMLLRNVMEEQWLLKPKDLTTEHQVNELYQRLDRHMSEVEQVLKNFGQNTQNLSNTAANVKQNIQFMNQLNQNYTYVQIPLKLANQNAHSDLYVYTGKRKKGEQDDDLTAFLHLDMDHLGSTDVSIRLHQKKVTTNFYMADDASYELLMHHLEELEERLAKKGYQAKISVNTEDKTPSFVEKLLEAGKTSGGGTVHRYSFDVRA